MSAVPYPKHPDPSVEWTGAKRRYDLVKEATIALVAVTLLTVAFSVIFSSPDVKPVTVSSWATKAPQDFLATALSELDGTSGVATYGPPYTHVPGAGQNIIGHFSIQRAGRRPDPDRHRERIRARPALDSRAVQPEARGRTCHLSPCQLLQQRKAWTDAFGQALAHARYLPGAITLTPRATGPCSC